MRDLCRWVFYQSCAFIMRCMINDLSIKCLNIKQNSIYLNKILLNLVIYQLSVFIQKKSEICVGNGGC